MTEPIPITKNQPEAPVPPLPAFEGRVVEQCIMRISGATPLEEVDVVVSVDDVLHLEGEYKVVSIRHYVDPKTGDLVREQVLKPVIATISPWNPDDPNDDGVIRKVKP